jgi:hypothetical protein
VRILAFPQAGRACSPEPPVLCAARPSVSISSASKTRQSFAQNAKDESLSPPRAAQTLAPALQQVVSSSARGRMASQRRSCSAVASTMGRVHDPRRSPPTGRPKARRLGHRS